MTNEKAIEICRNIMPQRGTPVFEALDLAIKTLEQKPCEDCLPSVTSTRPTAHWILLDECLNSGYYCSECHKKVIKEGWSNTVKKVKYCPNCGARMAESEE